MIGLRTLLELVDKAGDDFKYVRCLSCDVLEMQLLAGNNIELEKVQEVRNLVGVVQDPKVNMMSLNSDGRKGRGLVAHIIPNGILEIHRGRWLGGIAPWKGVDLASEVERKGEIVWALVATESEDGEEEVHLFCRYGKMWFCPTEGSVSEYFKEEHRVWWLDALQSKECLHSFEQWGTTGLDEGTRILELCQYCGEERERPAEPGERMSSEEFMSAKIHKVCHAFEEHMGGGDILALEVQGYDAMERAEEFAKKYPEDIQVVGVDDATFSSSVLVLINHRTDKEFMGTSVYYIPQNGGTGAEFFLYRGHRKELLSALRLIEKQQAAYPPHPLDC